jgi:hypothetical protein
MLTRRTDGDLQAVDLVGMQRTYLLAEVTSCDRGGNASDQRARRGSANRLKLLPFEQRLEGGQHSSATESKAIDSRQQLEGKDS